MTFVIFGASVLADLNGVQLEEVGKLTANWEFGSVMDGITHHFDMCGGCFQVTLSTLKKHRLNITMLDY